MAHHARPGVDSDAPLVVTLVIVTVLAAACSSEEPVASLGAVDCDADDGGLDLPDGFCARVVAKDLGMARHIAVDEDGDIYVALRDLGRSKKIGVAALRDTTGDGVTDVRERFDREGGTGIALRNGWLYFGGESRIVRWPLRNEGLAPSSPP